MYEPNKQYVASSLLNLTFHLAKAESSHFSFFFLYTNKANMKYFSIEHAGQFGMFSLGEKCKCNYIVSALNGQS